MRYDAENDVKQAAHENGSLVYQYDYDGDGHRVKRVREEFSGGHWTEAEAGCSSTIPSENWRRRI